MAFTQPEKAFCVLEFAKSESWTLVQRAFRTKFRKEAPERNPGIIRSDFPEVEQPDCNLWTLLYPCFQKWANLTAWICTETSRTYTYKELCEGSLRIAKALQGHFADAHPPTVAIISPNNPEFVMTFLATAAVGGGTLPVRHDYDPNFVSSLLQQVRATAVVVDHSVSEKFKDVLLSNEPALKVYVRDPFKKPTYGEDLMSILRSSDKGMDVEKAKMVKKNSVVITGFSSGTTGKPKGIEIMQKTISNYMSCMVADNICPVKMCDGTDQDVTMALLPLSHVFGLVYYGIITTLMGCQVVSYVSKPGSTTEHILDIMEQYQPRVVHVNPVHIEAFSKARNLGKAFESVRFLENLGSPPDLKVYQELKDKTGGKLILHDNYGMTETGPLLTHPLSNIRPGMTGKLLCHVSGRFVDVNTGEPITEPFKPGEFYVQSNNLMKGYLENPEETKNSFAENNWFKTGDVGYFDEDNYIVITDRYKELITVDGQKVSPLTIEKLLKQHASVLDAGVAGAPDAVKGEVPRAYVIRKCPVEERELVSFVQTNGTEEMRLLGGVAFVETLPRNHLGKLVRKTLRDFTWINK